MMGILFYSYEELVYVLIYRNNYIRNIDRNSSTPPFSRGRDTEEEGGKIKNKSNLRINQNLTYPTNKLKTPTYLGEMETRKRKEE